MSGRAPSPQLALPGTADGGEWQLRPSRRARRLAVRVLPGGLVEVVVPPGTRARTVRQFVVRHRRWIEHKLELYRPRDGVTADRLPEALSFPATGQAFALRYLPDPGRPRLLPRAHVIEVRGQLTRAARVRHLLQRYTMRYAHRMLGQRLEQLSAATGLGFARVQIRRQRTRWGSCSRSGTISLNACLLFQPPAVVDYLLLHELAHTRHADHSRRFWSLVADFEPRWRELDGALMRGWREVPAWMLR